MPDDWVVVQRRYRRDGKLLDKQIEKLDRIGMKWNNAGAKPEWIKEIV